jgi:uncharacterized iron-regulated membrane protein
MRKGALKILGGSLYGMIWRWHFLAALIVIPFVLWQSITGTLYLWSEWWMDATHPALRFVDPAPTRARASAQIAAAFKFIIDADLPLLQVQTDPLAQGRSAAGAVDNPANGPPMLDLLLSDDPHRSTVVLVQQSNGLPVPIFIDPYSAQPLGSLTAAAWLPGVTRALHGGWPVSPFGSWLLELGDSWAIAMIFTGFYLWWPRGRSIGEALWPRWRAGPRTIICDLHATVAVLFSAVFLFFLISALPWTAFWGGQLLSRIQSALGQDSPAGFSNGGASTAQMISVADSIDEVIAAVRARGASGSLSVRLAPWPKAPLLVTDHSPGVVDDRIILGDTTSGEILADFRERDFPVLARLVAIGVHVHQGDFGPINLWLNTAFALSLVWLSTTGIASWWIRRPKLQSGIPPKTHAAWPRSLLAIVGAMCLLLPIFAASVLTVATIDRLMRSVRLFLAASLRA